MSNTANDFAGTGRDEPEVHRASGTGVAREKSEKMRFLDREQGIWYCLKDGKI